MANKVEIVGGRFGNKMPYKVLTYEPRSGSLIYYDSRITKYVERKGRRCNRYIKSVVMELQTRIAGEPFKERKSVVFQALIHSLQTYDGNYEQAIPMIFLQCFYFENSFYF